ncbi:MAG: hypothetical protein QOJ09_1495, partial [Actinomycetota bacterium]|nr:hypothetical protein [Actinomycetota bacterium]
MHRAAVFVVLALLVAACTNSGGKSADK